MTRSRRWSVAGAPSGRPSTSRWLAREHRQLRRKGPLVSRPRFTTGDIGDQRIDSLWFYARLLGGEIGVVVVICLIEPPSSRTRPSDAVHPGALPNAPALCKFRDLHHGTHDLLGQTLRNTKRFKRFS